MVKPSAPSETSPSITEVGSAPLYFTAARELAVALIVNLVPASTSVGTDPPSASVKVIFPSSRGFTVTSTFASAALYLLVAGTEKVIVAVPAATAVTSYLPSLKVTVATSSLSDATATAPSEVVVRVTSAFPSTYKAREAGSTENSGVSRLPSTTSYQVTSSSTTGVAM